MSEFTFISKNGDTLCDLQGRESDIDRQVNLFRMADFDAWKAWQNVHKSLKEAEAAQSNIRTRITIWQREFDAAKGKEVTV